MRSLLTAILLVVATAAGTCLRAQLQHAPEPRPVGELTAVPMDIQKLEATLVFDAAEAAGHAVADVWFTAGKVDGTPVFDLRQAIDKAQLDGKPLDPEKMRSHRFGRLTGTMRILEKSLKAGSEHHLHLEYPVGRPSVPSPLPPKFTEHGVQWDTWASDLNPGRYLEQWFPANLLYDQFEFVLTLKLEGGAENIPHEVITNGEVENAGKGHWKITFPKHFTAFSPMVVLMPKSQVKRSQTVVRLTNGQKITIDACIPTRLEKRGATLERMHAAAKQALEDFTKQMGPWPHGDRCTIYEYSGGRSMEYDGATTSSFGALRHELFHSYFGRGLKPASQNGGWWDEAFTVYFLAQLRARSRPNRIGRARRNRGGRMAGRVALSPADPWNRVTPGAAYSLGAWFFAEVGKVIGSETLHKAMRELVATHAPNPISTAQLQAKLEKAAGKQRQAVADLFDFVVYGHKPRVRFTTEFGDFDIELELAVAPVTVKNFLRYVEAGFYDGGRFHRSVRKDNQVRKDVLIEVVQGGINPKKRKDGFPPIDLETTRRTRVTHRDGTISMARSQAPASATSDFFICIGDQPELDWGGERNADGEGFAAFGRVVKGMDVIRKIHAGKTKGESLTPPIAIRSAKRLRR